MTTGKTIALTMQIFVSKVMSLLFNMMSRFVIALLPIFSLNFMAAVPICGDFGAQENKVCHYEWIQWTTLIQWTWIGASFGIQWRTGKPGVLQSMGLQGIRNDLADEQQHYSSNVKYICNCHWRIKACPGFKIFEEKDPKYVGTCSTATNAHISSRV